MRLHYAHMLRLLIHLSCGFLLIVVVGCGSPAHPPELGERPRLEEFSGSVEGFRELVDLVKRARSAEAIHEFTDVEIGVPGSESALVSGWDRPEPSGTSGFSIWATTETAIVDLLLLDTAFHGLDFRCRTFSWAGGPDQVMTIVINGREIDQLTLKPSFSNHSVRVPPGVLGIGTNRIELRFAWVAKPVDHLPDSTDVRTLAAAFQRLALTPACVF